MSRLNPQEEFVITENPVKKYLTIKNTYTEEKIYSKGKEKIVKVLDSPVLAYSEKTEDEEGNIEYIKKVEWNTEGSTVILMVDANIGVRPQ